MTASISSELLARYLSGEAEPRERAAVEAWASADPGNAQELERLRTIWSSPSTGDWDVDRAWVRVADRLDREPVLVESERRRPILARSLALAASLAMAALGAWLVWRVVRPAGLQAPQVVATAPGERRNVDLPDGTRIILAPGTELRVDPAYRQSERRVDLEGEAWFEVRHDASRPFRVHAGGTMVEDLGTEFVVRAIRGANLVRVVVVSGSASLRRAGAPADEGVTLRARDVATLGAGETRPFVERGVEVGPLVAWHEGRLDFEDARLDSVVAELSRWYGVTIRLVDNDLGARPFTGPLRLDDLDDALEVLTLSLDLRVGRVGDTVVVR
jgi:transmembrane sensor